MPGLNGGTLNVGNPGNAGGGRPTKAFRNFLADLRSDPDAQAAIAEAARNSASRNFKAAWDVITDYDDEKPAKKLDVDLPAAERERRVMAILAEAKKRKTG